MWQERFAEDWERPAAAPPAPAGEVGIEGAEEAGISIEKERKGKERA